MLLSTNPATDMGTCCQRAGRTQGLVVYKAASARFSRGLKSLVLLLATCVCMTDYNTKRKRKGRVSIWGEEGVDFAEHVCLLPLHTFTKLGDHLTF